MSYRKPPVRVGPRPSKVPKPAQRTVARRPDPEEAHIERYLPLKVLDPPVRQSAVADLVRCPRYGLLRYWAGLVQKGRKKAIDIGVMFHLIMRYLYEGHDWDGAMGLLAHWVQQEHNGIMRWGHDEGRIQDAERACEELERDSSLASVMAYLYNERFPVDLDRYEIKAVEQKLRVPVQALGGAEVTMTLDLLLWSRPDKGYFIQDYKTTSTNLDLWKDAIKFKFQPRIYRLGAQLAINAGLVAGCKPGPVLGFVHGVVYRPRLQRKSWQTFEEFLHELIDYYESRDDVEGFKDENGQQVLFKSGPRAGKPKPRWEHADNGRPWGEGPPMDRFLTRFSGDLLSKEVKDALQLFVNAKGVAPTLSNFPRLGALHGMCSNHYGGCCPYLPLCSRHPSEWQDTAKKLYRIEVPELVEPNQGGPE